MWWKNWLINRLGSLVIVAGPRQARFFHGPNSEQKWALSHTNGIILFWSQLDNLLTRYGGNTTDINNASRIKMISNSIKQIDADTVEQQQSLQLLAEQLALVYAAPKGRRYSTDMLILAFTWYHKSPACYHII